MNRTMCTLAILGFLVSLAPDIKAQSILRRIEKVKSSIENATKVEKERQEQKQEEKGRTNPAVVEKSPFHEQHIGKILFAEGMPEIQLQDAGQSSTIVDLSRPFAIHAYLEDPVYAIKARRQKLGQYDYVAPAVIKKYYINGQLIASYPDQIEQDIFKNKAVISDVLVPADYGAFESNEMRIGVLAHVFSTLSSGTHKLKVEYFTVISTPRPSSTGSAATEYDNEELMVASGEVDLKIEAVALNAYCKKYARPKFGKGVLVGQPQLEKQVADLIRSLKGKDPVYIYADDNWNLTRGNLDRVISRNVQIYYIFKNSTGRCEAANFSITQSYDGKTYYAPKESPINRMGPIFKFVACQNY